MNREALLALLKPAKAAVKAVPLPEGTAYIRRMAMDEKDKWDTSLEGEGKRNMQDWRAKFLVYVLCDVEGQRLFKDEDWPLLKGAVNAYGALLFEEAWSFNGCDKEELEALKKNSDGAGASGSGSSSASS